MRGKRCMKCNGNGNGNGNGKGKGKGKSKKPRFFHEDFTRRAFDAAFWTGYDLVPGGVCVRCDGLKTRCATCHCIFSQREDYTYHGKSRWFMFDYTLKVRTKTGEIRIVAVIETNGPSHRRQLRFNGAKADLKDQKLRDKLKQRHCERKGIHLEWIDCYFSVKGGKKRRQEKPNFTLFRRLVEEAILRTREKLLSGDLGPEAVDLVVRHWNGNWKRTMSRI